MLTKVLFLEYTQLCTTSKGASDIPCPPATPWLPQATCPPLPTSLLSPAPLPIPLAEEEQLSHLSGGPSPRFRLRSRLG